MSEKILVVDDELKLLEIVEGYLLKEGYKVFSASSGYRAMRLYDEVNPDFIILDLMLPDLSGEEICRRIREKSDVPILMLTAKNGEEERINGLAIGADDYLTKPFSPRELVMRVKAILRRTRGNIRSPERLSFNNDDLVIDKEGYVVFKKDEVVNVTPNEYKILLALAENPNRTFSRGQLINAALGYDFTGYDRTIDTHIKNLRQKIEDDIKDPKYIVTVYGVGYKFVDPSKQEHS